MEVPLKEFTVTNIRDGRFGEIMVVGAEFIEVFNTTGLNDCPAEVWDTLDLEKIKQQFGGIAVQKNGPKFWMMDSQTLWFGQEQVSLAGLEARWAARVPAALARKGESGSEPYKYFTPKKHQRMVYDKGKPVFELVDNEGHVYVLQAHDQRFTMETLATLGDQMKQLPAGWQYRTRILTEDLVLDLTPDQTIYSMGDEFHQYYTRITT